MSEELCLCCLRLSWSAVIRLLENEREDVIDEVEFEAAMNGEMIATARVKAIYEALAPGAR